MMKYILMLFFFLDAFLFRGLCAQNIRTVRIEPDVKYQTMEGFGASDCWTVQYVGKYWNESEKEKAAGWLFSDEVDSNGNPMGIGLSIWRVNLGAGTIEQGDNGQVNDITRRAECFLGPDGTYDWNKQIGQQWFVDKAKKYGCRSFVLFSNSPYVGFTRNGKGFATKGDENSNLKEDKYDDFADFLATVASYFVKEKKINVDYISPVNEPQWKWDSDYQEGSPWTNAEIKKVVVELDKALDDKKLDTKILVTEAGTWEAMYKKEGRAFNQIPSFFDPSSDLYIGDLKRIDKTIGAHSYWTDTKNQDIRSIRTNVKNMADRYGVKVFQTEWSMLNKTPIDDFPSSYAEASYNDIALHMAKIIYSDIVYAGVASWSYWTSMDVEMYGFKNRFNLIRLHTEGDKTASIEKGGYVSATKTLWMLGNYSRFVKPGFTRVGLYGADDLSSVMGTAYLSYNKKRIVAVFTNVSENDCRIDLNVSSLNSSNVKSACSYLTDETSDLGCKDITDMVVGRKDVVVPRRSTLTVVLDLKRRI